MSAPSMARFWSPETRTALFYTSFFTLPGATAAYLGIWLQHKGIDPGGIGWINSVPILLIVLFNLGVGRLADRASDWRVVIVVGVVIAALAGLGLLLAHVFWAILLVLIAMRVPQGLVSPVIDAAAMRMTRRRGTSFSALRAWGTIGYMLGTVLMGGIAGLWGPEAFVPAIVVFTVVRALVSLTLPQFRAAPSPEAAGAAPAIERRLGVFLRPFFLFPLLAFALVQATHFLLSGFAALIWRDAGVSAVAIGWLLAIGPLVEALVMFGFARVSRRFTARHLIGLAGLATLIRFAGLALNPPLWGLFVLQLLHGVTFGLGYLGTINFIANWTPEARAAEAQSFSVLVQLSLTFVALSGFGYLVPVAGLYSFFVPAAMGAAAMALVALSVLMTPPQAQETVASA